MAGATRVLAVTTAIGLVASVYLLFENRSLHSELADTARPAAEPAKTVVASETDEDADPWTETGPRSAKIPNAVPAAQPQLPEEKTEHRLDRRARRTEEFAARFGRLEGETEEAYKQRIGPLITAGLALPRMRAADYRRHAEEKASVTPEQSNKLDQAMEKVYADVIDYTNKAVSDGTLSPYERNVAGWLDYAGGLGGMLSEAQGQFGKILSPEQMKAMSGAGFEWGEYLGLTAPWENLGAPPPPKK